MGEFWGFIKDPLYGYIQITEAERNVIDTYPFQRLRRIKQLSGSEFVYPAANHTRFEHSLGTMYLAGVVGENLPVGLEEDEIQLLKFAALLHDVGHGPFSHVFDSYLTKYLNKTHEDMTVTIIEETELGEALNREGFDPKSVGRLASGNLKDPSKPYLDQVIVGAVDVDKMDFVSRDSYHTGAGYGYTDIFRLIYTMDVHEGELMVNATAIPTLETFLIARLESFKTIYFHKASRAAQIMLVKALESAREDVSSLNFETPEEYLRLDDYVLWRELRCSEAAKPVMEDLERRRLLKCAYEITLFTKDRLVTSIFANEAVRRRVEEEIAETASVDPGYVTIDIPSLPSVPYSRETAEPMDIPVSFKSTDDRIEVRSVTEISRIIEVLRVYMNILRVYTRDEYRSKIRKASEEVLGALPSETKIAY
ncbi:MAG: HD domain-containing protein [Candidatus Bathyarchaeia archaeon]